MSRFRRLKIHSKYQSRSWKSITVPEIRLEGKWLAELGFEEGEHVQIEQLKGKLVITVNKDVAEKSS